VAVCQDEEHQLLRGTHRSEPAVVCHADTHEMRE
jgi:hypothetical protein